MKRILFMSEEEARTTLYCAGLTGEYEIVVVGNVERNQTIQHHPYCAKFIDLKNELKVDTDTQALAEELAQIIHDESIDILLPVSISCCMIIDRHKELFDHKVAITPYPTKESVDLLDDKYSFYLFCKENGIAHPESVLMNNSAEINAAQPGVSYPLLIKPILGQGGFDTLVFVHNQAEMNDFLARPKDKREGYFPALLQEFFEGQDIDVNGLSQDGKILASSVMETEFYDKDIDLNFTSFVKNDEVLELGERILKISKYSGPTNIDMRIRASDGKLMLIEVNPRYWARVHVSLMDGMNFLDIAIKSTLGEPYTAKSRCSSRKWISSIPLLIKTIILRGKFNYIGHLLSLGIDQLKFIVYKRKFMSHAEKSLRK